VLGEVLHQSTKIKTKKKESLLQQTPIDYRQHCLCESHYDKQLLEQTYGIKVDQLFDLIFGSNEFVRTYRQAQRFYGRISLT
jgi:hypothetical protein